MSLPVILTLALALAMDAFGVSIGISIHLGKVSARQIFRVAWHFGLFQFAMPLIGFYAGEVAGGYISHWTHIVAFGLLCLIGVRMIVGACREKDKEEKSSSDPTKGLTLVSLMIATSIDALAAGISISFLHNVILKPAIIIGIVAFLLSAIGMLTGSRIGLIFGKRAEMLGGVVLVALALKILIKDLL
ncbi:manganese efflux pump MntP family protein [Acidobacteriota bacterium]